MTYSPGNFEYKEIDPEGFKTLSVISDATNFNNWVFETIRPWCSGKVLEIGSGIGNISERFVDSQIDITVSDIRKTYRDFLANKFPALHTQNKILPIDLVHPEFESEYRSHLNQFDTVFSLNVVEHIENDSAAILNASRFLKPGGTLVILVPAFQALYNVFDKELFHYKRYQRKDLETLFNNNQIKTIKSFYFNAGGIPGWFVSGSIQKNKIIPPAQMKAFDKLVPAFKIIDKLLMNSVGLSVICIGKKL